MKPITGPEMCRLLENAGWRLQRVSGSHHIYTKAGERKVLSVPLHGNRDLKPGLANRLARDAGLRW
ncbi:MAG: type II toxin-antitoxin system HicA family toxin [Bryobacterales bacterium]|nr:type II toxin-antitoxin system HicA family toxin [Bryobacterales bacterium]